MPESRDNKMFEILVRQHHRRVLAYALSLVRQEATAEDLVQDAFLVAYKNLKKFDVNKDFGNWVRGIVRNKYREWARDRHEYSLNDETLAQLEARYEEWDRSALEQDADPLDLLQGCLQKLQDMARRVIRMFYEERRATAAIAQAVGASEAAVRKQLERTRKALLQCMERNTVAAG